MRFDNDAVPECLVRLRRIEGQVRGVIRMIETNRDCGEVIHQLAAVRRAMDRAGMRLLSAQLQQCLINQEDSPGSDGFDQERFERLFLMLT